MFPTHTSNIFAFARQEFASGDGISDAIRNPFLKQRAAHESGSFTVVRSPGRIKTG
jgi:hypothetical protein